MSDESSKGTENNKEALLSRAAHLIALQKELKISLQERFEANINAFKRYSPKLAEHFSKYTPSRKLDFFCTENGQANLLFVEQNEFLYKTETPCDFCANQVEVQLSSTQFSNFTPISNRDPFGQIHLRYIGEMLSLYDKQNFEQNTPLTLNSLPCCIMLGCGLGYQIGYLYSRVEVNNLVLIEPEEDLFWASLHAFDWASLLPYLNENHFELQFLIGKNPEDLYNSLSFFYEQYGRFLSGLRYTYVHYNSAKIEESYKVLEKNRTMYMSLVGFFDDQLFGLSHALQAVLNKKHFLRSDVELPENIRNLPWFVVGNGPSLDHDIAFLRRNQDKALIVACGTALETLYHAGIQPDFYGCTERTPEIADTLKIIPDKNFLKNVILLSADVVHPNVQQYFEHTAIFLKTDEGFYALATEYIPEADKLRKIYYMNPFVGNLGVSAGIYTGFKNIYLFGIDNGVKVGGDKLHSKFNNLYAQWADFDKNVRSNLKDLVPGNFGGQCSTGHMYLLSARIIEDAVKYAKEIMHKDTQFYNCSDGLYLEGVTPVHSESLVKEFDSFSKIDKGAVREFFDSKFSRTVELEKTKIPEFLALNKFKRICNDLIDIIRNPVHTRTEGIAMMHEASLYLYKISQSRDWRLLRFIEGSIQSMFMVMLYILYHKEDLELCLRAYRRGVSLTCHFLDDAKVLYAMLPNYILGKHQELLKGKVGRDYPDSKAPACPPLPNLVGKNYQYGHKLFVKRYE
ncbi:MAG: DUF115 domain-containing protein [Succinivibrio sp.]|nr:DUF115 domain-containing protein [Succinivibrio sp.]